MLVELVEKIRAELLAVLLPAGPLVFVLHSVLAPAAGVLIYGRYTDPATSSPRRRVRSARC